MTDKKDPAVIIDERDAILGPPSDQQSAATDGANGQPLRVGSDNDLSKRSMIIGGVGIACLAIIGLGTMSWLGGASESMANIAAPKSVEQVALDIIRMKACEISWNAHVQKASSDNISLNMAMMQDPSGEPASTGVKYAFSGKSNADVEVCGFYLVPGSSGTPSNLAQTVAITDTMSAFNSAAYDMLSLIVLAGESGPRTAPPAAAVAMFNSHVAAAVAQYRKALGDAARDLAGLPRTQPPALSSVGGNQSGFRHWWSKFTGNADDETAPICRETAEDMNNFDYFVTRAEPSAAK